MKFGVIVFPGSNCDRDCYNVVKNVLGEDVTYIWHGTEDLQNVDCVIIPGGFSYGDYLRTGAIAKYSKIMKELVKFKEQGGLIIGICNGFQILLEAGFLPGAMKLNKGLQFICDTWELKTVNNNTPFTNLLQEGQIISLPIAHKEGNYYCDEKTLKELKENNQIVFQYTNREGEISEETNPNGSVENIAGICSKDGRILGMMPHPEREAEAILGGDDGKYILQSIVKWYGDHKGGARA